MKLPHDIHLGYCTNIHRGETWDETFAGLAEYTLRVKDEVSPDSPYGIGLRLSADAATELSAPAAKDAFRDWLEANDCYLYTVNGFPFGKFHGTRVKEQVYAPDWSHTSRLEYTNLLFDLLADLAPEGQSISVSTLPGSFKEFITDDSQITAICRNLLACSDHIESVRQRTGRDVHLGLEPEPLGLFETSRESVDFFEQHLLPLSNNPDQVRRNLGINYDTCHLAIEYETAQAAIHNLRDAGLRISKLHLSSALSLPPTPEDVKLLTPFQDEVYLHQVVVRTGEEVTHRHKDLDLALTWAEQNPDALGDEWRIHFHIPLHARPAAPFAPTSDHIAGVLDLLAEDPTVCQHLEMETYTWEVLPEEMRSANVVDQLVKEYEWTLTEMQKRGLS